MPVTMYYNVSDIPLSEPNLFLNASERISETRAHLVTRGLLLVITRRDVNDILYKCALFGSLQLFALKGLGLRGKWSMPLSIFYHQHF